MSKPRFAHVVYQTKKPREMRDWYSIVLDGHVVYEDATLTFITYDEEHHRVALIHPPIPMEPKTPATAAMHHTAYTFDTLDQLLDRYVLLRNADVLPAVCISHGVTMSLYYRDPDGNFVEMQIDVFEKPEDATNYMHGAEYAADSVGPAFDPEKMLKERKNGASVAQLTNRSWCKDSGLGNPLDVLMSAPS